MILVQVRTNIGTILFTNIRPIKKYGIFQIVPMIHSNPKQKNSENMLFSHVEFNVITLLKGSKTRHNSGVFVTAAGCSQCNCSGVPNVTYVTTADVPYVTATGCYLT